MDTPIATSDDENLPGVPFVDRRREHLFERGADSIGRESTPPDPKTGRQLWSVRWVESTGSTNTDLFEAARRGGPHGLVLVADHQTAGRGRLDRSWEAPQGVNLLVSILIRAVPPHPHHVTQAVAVAAAEACEGVAARAGYSIRVDLKWPNDLLVEGRKLAGILASAGSLPGGPARGVGPDFVVVGLGLNIGWSPEGAISLVEVMVGAGNESTVPSDREIGDVRDEVLFELLDRLEGLLATAEETHEKYLRRLATLGRAVRVELPTGDVLEGRAIGLEVDGRLVVLDACAVTHRFDVGDIIHLR